MNKLLSHQRGSQLHIARLAVWKYQEAHGGELPPLHSQEAADACLKV